jgi:RNA 2',3'-cyclic 3'-phosphodiesterase
VRLFIAIDIPPNILSTIASFLLELRAVAPNVKWVRDGNLHLTLKFLGETDPARQVAIEDSLSSIRSAKPFVLDISGLGFFPNAKRPKIFWAGVNSSPDLQPLVAEIENAMHALGYTRDVRPFTPHLTLARFDQPGIPAQLAATVAANAGHNFGSFTVSEFHLIESKLKSTGAEYTTLQSFSFVTEAPR